MALGAGRQGEPGKHRPAVVISDDELDAGTSDELLVVVPMSSSLAPSALRVAVPTSAGVDKPSLVVCRAVRAVSASRFEQRLGVLDAGTVKEVESALAMILGLGRPTP